VSFILLLGRHPGDPEFFARRQFRRTVLGPDCWIGHGAVIRPDVTIGAGAVIAPGTVAIKDVAPS